MRKGDIKVGGHYKAKVGNRLVTVRVDKITEVVGISKWNGGVERKITKDYTKYDVTNLSTGRKTVFRSAVKFREALLNANDRYEGLKDGSVKPESLTEECIAKGTDWMPKTTTNN